MIDFNQAPYYDDYNKDGIGNNKFLKILFRPSFPVQSRELTQMQSIIQNQIEKFGSHIFKNGSKVLGGDLSINKVQYIVLKDNQIQNIDSLVGKNLRSQGGVVARVLNVNRSSIKTNDANNILFVNYVTGDSFVPGEQIFEETEAKWYELDSSTDSVGNASLASINSGVFFTNSYFVYTPDQTIFIQKTHNPTVTVGLSVSEYVVTESTDNSLYDPAYGSSNFNAPGAHRYVIDLELSTRLFTSINETEPDFIELIKLKDGEAVTEVKNPKYNEIEHELARRTYDESGSYVVKNFPITIEPNTDQTKLNVILDPGKAYVHGYELETVSKTVLEIDRARETESYNNSDAYIYYGFYVVVDQIVGGMFNFNGLEMVELLNDSSIGIGTARVKCVSVDGVKYRVYLTDIEISGGNSNEIRSIVSQSGTVATVDLASGVEEVIKGSSGNLLAPFFPENPKLGTITDVNYKTQRNFSGVLDTDGKMIIYTNSPRERFVGSGVYNTGDQFIHQNYIFVVAGQVTEPSIVEIPTVGNSEVGRLVVTFNSSQSGSLVQTMASLEINESSPKIKIKRSAQKTTSVGAVWVDLDHADVITQSISVYDEDGNDITNLFLFDDGQRDEFYSLGRVRKSNVDAQTVTVRYDYFEHSGVGYFTVDSYSGVDYAEIPKYVSGSVTYDLKNCFDFRPILTGTGSIISQIPPNNSSVSFDYEYFVARYDRVVATKSKELVIVRGVPELTPKVPLEPLDSMTLYILRVSPYTINEKDIGVRFVENRRYTMRDIGKLEKRIENLEYYTSLSLLETKTSTLSIDGKFRNGFLVDPFSDYEIADSNEPGFDCFIDRNSRICSPSFIPTNIEFDVVTIPNDLVRTVDGIVIKKYTEEQFVSQHVITGEVNVNPFNVFSWVGQSKLTPEIDTWIEENRLPDIINEILSDRVPLNWRPTTTVTRNNTGSVWISGATSWDARNRLMEDFVRRNGVVSTGLTGTSGDALVATLTTTTTNTSRIQERIVVNSTVDNTVGTAATPYIRGSEVEFEATGLLPNKRYYFRFDDIPVDDRITNLMNPGTIMGTPVNSDASGKIHVRFSIPAGVFKTGERVFRVSDEKDHHRGGETSYASAVYTAEGMIISKQRTVGRTRIREVVIDSSTNRTVAFSTAQTPPPPPEPPFIPAPTFTWRDPLAQTFLVDANQFPNGLFVSSIDLFFTQKDESIPITLELRPTVNGYPSSADRYPFAVKTLLPEEVVTNNINSGIKGYAYSEFKPTNFRFDTPVFLEPGEHSFVVMANTNRYLIGFATIGETILNSQTVMSENPYNGVMFKSQNSSTWSADQYSDIAFGINRCEFETGVSGDVVLRSKYEGEVHYDSFTLSSGVMNFDQTNSSFSVKNRISVSDSSVELYETKPVVVDQMNGVSSKRMSLRPEDIHAFVNISSTNILSSTLDLQRTHMVVVQNVINNDATGEETPYEGKAVARYMHKKVSLAEDFLANELRVWLDAIVPGSASIKVYVRHQNTLVDSTLFGDNGWVEMDLDSISGLERTYILSVPSGFNVYQVKVVMLSSDTTQIPNFTNFRVVTFQE